MATDLGAWRSRWRALLASGLAATVGALLLAVGTPDALGGYTTGVANTTNTSASAIISCANLATSASAYFAYPFAEASGTTAADVSGNNRPGTYNTAGVTYGATGPCPRDAGKAVTLNGSTGYITTNQAAFAGPSVFSEEIWFNTSTVRGGKLIGFGSSQTGSSGSYDRHLYMANNGFVYFGVYPGSVKTVASTKAYNDGAWHQAVGTLAPSGNNVGIRLYIDGALIATDTTVTTAQSYSGYWRIGYDNTSGWTSSPTSNFFAGSLAWAQVYSTALTPDQVKAMYTAGSP